MPEDLERPQAEQDVVPLKKDTLDEKQVSLWLNRAKTANKYHRQQILAKYNTAKERYNSENYGYQTTKKTATNLSFNFLYKDIEDFNSSIYYKNPEIDLTSRETDNPASVRNVENLEQIVNDDIKDNPCLKSLIRSSLVDEGLSSLGVIYLDYDYKTQDSSEQLGMDDYGQPLYRQEEVSNKVRPCKIRPENLIRPPFQTLYNYQESPYLGYVDIVSLECLKNDSTLDQEAVKQIRGKSYKQLMDVDQDQMKEDKLDSNDGLMFAKCYYIWVKGDDNKPLKRMVLTEDSDIKKPLAYDDWTKGNGPDGRGYPIHILALNDPADGFIPPSEAWILESILCTIDYLLVKMNKHLKKSKTRTIVKSGQGGIKQEALTKWVSNNDLEILPLADLPPGMDIRALVLQLQDQALNADHESMFALCKRVFDELSRKPSFAQAAVQEKKKTATESEAIQQQDVSQGSYKVDKFKDFLKGFFYDWAKLTQKNRRGIDNIKVKNRQTGQEEDREVIMSDERNDLDADFNVDINIETFVAPNKELKRRIIKETIMDLQGVLPLLGGRKTLNGERAALDLLQNVNVRNPEGYLIDKPVRNVDQQVMDYATKGVPMSIEELGDNPRESLTRLMQIFSDGEQISQLEVLSPGLGSSEQSPLVLMMKDLQGMIQMQEKQKPNKSSSDMRSNAAMMGAAQ